MKPGYIELFSISNSRNILLKISCKTHSTVLCVYSFPIYSVIGVQAQHYVLDTVPHRAIASTLLLTGPRSLLLLLKIFHANKM